MSDCEGWPLRFRVRQDKRLSKHRTKRQKQANELAKSRSVNAKHQSTKTFKGSMKICIKNLSAKHATVSVTETRLRWQIDIVPLSRIAEVSSGVCAT